MICYTKRTANLAHFKQRQIMKFSKKSWAISGKNPANNKFSKKATFSVPGHYPDTKNQARD